MALNFFLIYRGIKRLTFLVKRLVQELLLELFKSGFDNCVFVQVVLISDGARNERILEGINFRLGAYELSLISSTWLWAVRCWVILQGDFYKVVDNFVKYVESGVASSLSQ